MSHIDYPVRGEGGFCANIYPFLVLVIVYFGLGVGCKHDLTIIIIYNEKLILTSSYQYFYPNDNFPENPFFPSVHPIDLFYADKFSGCFSQI